jgi:hypothetical protein
MSGYCCSLFVISLICCSIVCPRQKISAFLTPPTLKAAFLMSVASLNAIGQNGLEGTNSILNIPGSSSLTLVIICISAKDIPVSGSTTCPTASRTLSSSSVKLSRSFVGYIEHKRQIYNCRRILRFSHFLLRYIRQLKAMVLG